MRRGAGPEIPPERGSALVPVPVHTPSMNSNPNHFTHDPYDAEWESPNTGRTVWTSADDLDLDDFCPVCQTTVRAGDCPECLDDQASA